MDAVYVSFTLKVFFSRLGARDIPEVGFVFIDGKGRIDLGVGFSRPLIVVSGLGVSSALPQPGTL